MPRGNYDYSQTVIGDCGHACSVWPQITPLGGGPPVEVICDECTRIKYGLNADTSLAVYVRVKEEVTPVKKTAPKKKGVKTVRCSICQERGHLYNQCPLLGLQGSLLDGA